MRAAGAAGLVDRFRRRMVDVLLTSRDPSAELGPGFRVRLAGELPVSFFVVQGRGAAALQRVSVGGDARLARMHDRSLGIVVRLWIAAPSAAAGGPAAHRDVEG